MICVCGADGGNGAFCVNCGRPFANQVTQYAPPIADPNGLSIAGIVLGSVSFFLSWPLTPLPGLLGVVFASIAKSQRQRLSTVALTISIIGCVVGFIVFSSVLLYLVSGGY